MRIDRGWAVIGAAILAALSPLFVLTQERDVSIAEQRESLKCSMVPGTTCPTLEPATAAGRWNWLARSEMKVTSFPPKSTRRS